MVALSEIPNQALPARLRRALDVMTADVSGSMTVEAIAEAAGVASRTLQKHFRRFLGRTPLDVLRGLRLDRARRELLLASRDASVTMIATRCGFTHLGRFAAQYRKRFGENPSTTLHRRNIPPREASFAILRPAATERPAVAVLPFVVVDRASRQAAAIAEEIGIALSRLRWLSVTDAAYAQYHIRGKVRSSGTEHVRATVLLVDARMGRYLWADHWDGPLREACQFEERVAYQVATAIQAPLRSAEMSRAWQEEPARLNAWKLTMRALRLVLSVEGAAEARALEWLEQAMELSPQDPLPPAVAAWCHGLRGGHHFAPDPQRERAAARDLATRAAALSPGDAMTEAMLAAGYTLAHDLPAATLHAERALALDGSCSWAWGRCGWVETYRGEPGSAIERFQIARALAPSDPLRFLWAIGIGAAQFEAGRYPEAVRWYQEARDEHPTAVWNNRFLAPAYALSGRKDEAVQCLSELTIQFPDLTTGVVRRGLPYTRSFLDRIAEGLVSVGMQQ